MTQDPDVLDRLTLALDGLAHGLETGSADAVLAAQAPLAAATSALCAVDLETLTHRPDLRVAVMNARLALDRCRTLGASAAAVAAAFTPTAYGSSGRRLPPSSAQPTLTART